MDDLDIEKLEIDLLLEAVHQRFGYDFRSYARASLDRRVRGFLESCGCDATAPNVSVTAAQTGKETILIVEDDAGVRALAVRILKALGDIALEADGLQHAVEMAATHAKIDLLLTDVVMAGGGGRDVSTAVRKLHPEARVLFMSGYTDDAIANHGVLEPDVAFLNKPFTRATLGEKVRDALDNTPAVPEHPADLAV